MPSGNEEEAKFRNLDSNCARSQGCRVVPLPSAGQMTEAGYGRGSFSLNRDI
jgi:hypothetical protein